LVSHLSNTPNKKSSVTLFTVDSNNDCIFSPSEHETDGISQGERESGSCPILRAAGTCLAAGQVGESKPGADWPLSTATL